MIPFNKPPCTGNEQKHVLASMRSDKISGDGQYSRMCQKWFEQRLGCYKALLTPSCTNALELAALLIDIRPDDEIIMPSYTFVSTANAFVLRGAKIVFVDVRPDTMNIDEKLIEAAITDKTKAIVPVHYAGVACEMDTIMDIAARNGLFVIEDAAQAMMSSYKGRPVGTFAPLAAYSFHETKNFTSAGEGGLIIINDEKYADRAEIIREKGTNRSLFFRGMVDKYSWVDLGSSYLPCDLQAAYLWGQLEDAEEIIQNRMKSWHRYYQAIRPLEQSGLVELPQIPPDCLHNAHIFYLKVKDLDKRTRLIAHLKKRNILAVFHYVPLHSSTAGKKFSRFHGSDKYTTIESERLIRLPLWYGMELADQVKVIDAVKEFYS